MVHPFLEPGKLLIGINYWASDNALHMWRDFHPEVIERDFQKLSSCGVRALRVFPLWSDFQPLTAAYGNDGIYELQLQGEPLPDTEAGRAGVSEVACEHFAEFCALAEKYGLRLVVGLITGHMSGRYFAPEPFGARNPVNDPTLVKWQLRFVRYFVGRFKSAPAIAAWDLGNEVNGFANRADAENIDHSYVWASNIANAIRVVDGVHPVITGYDFPGISNCAFNLEEIGEYADISTVHPYNIFATNADPLPSMRPILDGIFRCRLSDGISGVPSFIQEVGSLGYLNCSERTETDFYRALLYAAWSHGCGSVMWWCAFDQGMQSYAPYDWNNIGSDYGFFRGDGSPKPIATENIRFCDFIRSLPFDRLPEQITDGVCIVPRTQGRKDVPMLRAAWCLAKQANMDLTFVGHDRPLPDSPLYILPSLDNNRAITRRRLMALLDKVRAGATLYISLGSALFRMIPELSGVTFAYREAGGEESVTLGKEKLTVRGDFKYYPEDTGDTEILARAADGRAVYTRHRFGQGYIYLSTVPMEKYLSTNEKAFRSKGGSDYAAWYRVFYETASSVRVFDTDSRVIRMTEHIVDEKTRYVVLINYSEQRARAKCLLADGWYVETMLRGQYTEGSVELSACDAAVAILKKTEI